MSAEGGELTFVRCPSCRSLVPAVSTRCRWCGNSLGGGAASDAPKDDAPARRVRQKTRSIQAGEYVPQPTREKGSQEVEEISQDDDYDLEDPLKGFIEEVEEEISDEEILSSLAEVEEESQKNSGNAMSNGNRQSSNGNSPSSNGNRQFGQIAASSQVASEDEYGNFDDDPEFELESDLQLEPEMEPQPEVRAEPESAKANKTSGVAHGDHHADDLLVAADVEEPFAVRPDPVEQSSFAQEVPHMPESKPQPQRFNTQRVMAPHKTAERRVDSENVEAPIKPLVSAERPSLTENLSVTVHPSVTGHKPGEEMNKTHYEADAGGKLYGWLVSYSTADGKAFELREGRFFISGSPLKGNDFVIKDSSVSTPHAMVNVSRTAGFAIQDLMSDRGIFIRRRGQDTYQREDGIAKCSHGDWIRVGDVEYLLTVVADVGK